MATYDKGDLVRLTATFRDSANALVDPSTVTLKIHKPDGSTIIRTYAGATITRSSLGVFYSDLNCDFAGTVYYRWEGAGAAQAAGQSSFFVEDLLGI